MMRTLIWKELLVHRFPLLLAAALVVASYAVTAIMDGLDPSLTLWPWTRRLSGTLLFGSLASHATAQLSLAILAGNLIAVERANRSAEFLAYLPVSRATMLQSKAILFAATAVVLLLIPLAVAGLAVGFAGLPSSGAYRRDMLFVLVSISAAGFCASGIGWLGSCTLQSNAAAILFALLGPWLLDQMIITASRGTTRGAILLAANLSVGLAGFLFGTRHYLYRVEP